MTIKDIPGYANLINLDYLKPLNEVLTRDTGDFNGTIEQLTTCLLYTSLPSVVVL